MLCFNSVKVTTIFTTRFSFSSSQKDILSIVQQSRMIYKFQCQCDADNIGRTIQRLEIQVQQHIPWELLRWSQNDTSKSSLIQESAIGNHFSSHYICRTNYTKDHFSVCKKHLAILEAMAIALLYPSLCKQRRQFDTHCLFGELSGNLESCCPVGWDCRIHRLLLCRGGKTQGILNMTLNNLMVKL